MSSSPPVAGCCADELGGLARARAQLRAIEADMVAVPGELGLSRLGDIPGLTCTGAAAILAETGDPRRYDSSSALVKHAGMSPADKASGAFTGDAHISRTSANIPAAARNFGMPAHRASPTTPDVTRSKNTTGEAHTAAENHTIAEQPSLRERFQS